MQTYIKSFAEKAFGKGFTWCNNVGAAQQPCTTDRFHLGRCALLGGVRLVAEAVVGHQARRPRDHAVFTLSAAPCTDVEMQTRLGRRGSRVVNGGPARGRGVAVL